jgi:hypothetical protein
MAKRVYIDSYPGLPESRGLLSITSESSNGGQPFVRITGDSEGLLYLSQLLHYMSKVDVEKQDMPRGARAHVPLRPRYHLLEGSCEIEVCRAEAKETGELPADFK